MARIHQLKQYRKLHCFYKNYLFLCPDKKFTFFREDHKQWIVTTNAYGERITKRASGKNQYNQEIWFIGDSISFGYLVSDENTTPYLLDLYQDIPVRNLGVDSIGTLGILNRLQKALKDHPDTKIQYLFWIYNTSDFTDDIIENNQNHIRKSLFFLHYNLGKISNIYNTIFLLKKELSRNNTIPETISINSDIQNFNHITYKNIIKLYKYILSEKRIKNFLIIVYPGMNIKTKKPDIDSTVTLSLYQFLKQQNIPVLNVFSEFTHSQNPYFTFDGHPSEEGYNIFTKVLIAHLKHL
ncbi:MAG: hypothetical protein KatS3mg129_0625 [Leptospiraceae bacterium]|nr:MAG: hypothetical protein KatS3mg129_0625 [Leptospiraceae bacterium]